MVFLCTLPLFMNIMRLSLNLCYAPLYSPVDFIKEADVTKAFQSLELKSFSSPDGIPNVPLKYVARKLTISSNCP